MPQPRVSKKAQLMGRTFASHRGLLAARIASLRYCKKRDASRCKCCLAGAGCGPFQVGHGVAGAELKFNSVQLHMGTLKFLGRKRVAL